MTVTSGVPDTSYSHNHPISTVSLPPLSRRSTEALDRKSEGAKKAFSFEDVVRIARDKAHNKAIKVQVLNSYIRIHAGRCICVLYKVLNLSSFTFQASLESLPEGRPLASTLASQGLNWSSVQPLTTTSASPGTKWSSIQVSRSSSPVASTTTVFGGIQEPLSYANEVSPSKRVQENLFQDVIDPEKTAQSSVSFAPTNLKGLETVARTDRKTEKTDDAHSSLLRRPSFSRGRTKLNLADGDIDIGIILKQAAEDDRWV